MNCHFEGGTACPDLSGTEKSAKKCRDFSSYVVEMTD